ncbi:MAG: VWA domain-containing protein [bacterium]
MKNTPRNLSFRRKNQPLGAIEIVRQLHRRHLVWYGIAILVSVLLHLLLILFLPGISAYKIVTGRSGERPISLRLENVKAVPETPESDRRPPKFTPETAKAAVVAGAIDAEMTTVRRALDESSVEPRQVGAGILIGEQRTLTEPAHVDRPVWEPRQEILSINQKIVKDDAAINRPRRTVQSVPREKYGVDIAAPASRDTLERGISSTGVYYLVDDPSQFTWGRGMPAGAGLSGVARDVSPPKTMLQEEPRKLAEEDRNRITILKALEKYLKAEVYLYRSPADPLYDYCRIEIMRRKADLLPILAKDLLLVQDGSASITEQKLRFCREGMLKALDLLVPGDRFNVIEFRDSVSRCFETWATVNPDTLQQAREFIGRMESVGNTDIFDSLKDLLATSRQSGRPVILMMVSDGVATAGLTDHSLIIEAFSQANRGAVSVFTVGTYPGVNAYLLDLLSFRNRGDTFVVNTGRWDIPAVIAERVREVSRPVLSDVRFRFSGQTYCEAYPVLTANLYMDRPLVLFGRVPRNARKLTFQATGQAADIQCDMVFDLDLAKALGGEADIRTQWAWQRAYFLIGEHNRMKQPGVLTELKALGKTYGIKIPYRNEWGQ